MDNAPEFIDLVGIEIDERQPGLARASLEIAPHHRNPHGVVHGGVLYTLADTSMGAALYPLLAEDEVCATIDVTIVYMRPVTAGRVECETRVVNKGRRVAVLESRIHAGDRDLATALGTYAIFETGDGRPEHRSERPTR